MAAYGLKYIFLHMKCFPSRLRNCLCKRWVLEGDVQQNLFLTGDNIHVVYVFVCFVHGFNGKPQMHPRLCVTLAFVESCHHRYPLVKAHSSCYLLSARSSQLPHWESAGVRLKQITSLLHGWHVHSQSMWVTSQKANTEETHADTKVLIWIFCFDVTMKHLSVKDEYM